MGVHEDRGPRTQQVSNAIPSLNGLCERGRITWAEREHGWVGMPEEILAALAMDGFHECAGQRSTSVAGDRPASGTWRGVNPRMRSMVAADWMSRPAAAAATLFIEIDSQSITGPARL